MGFERGQFQVIKTPASFHMAVKRTHGIVASLSAVVVESYAPFLMLTFSSPSFFHFRSDG